MQRSHSCERQEFRGKRVLRSANTARTSACATLLVAISAFAAQPELQRAEGSVDAMGTAYTIVAYGEDRGRLQSAISQGLEEARRLDEMLSNYKPSSEWSMVNRMAGSGPVHITPELFQLLSACVEYSRQSEGAFDITVGPLMRVWGFYKGSGHLPHRAEVWGALNKIGWRNIILDPAHLTVKFANPSLELDPGGIGKGYAVDRIVQILKDNGIRQALVSGGGSSIYALGAPPGEKGWKLDIKNPRKTEETIESVYLKDLSMSTSGNYEKFFYAEGKMYSHIMDPRTGYPSQGMLSTSVIAPRTLDSEAWTKPYYILGPQWAAKHKHNDFRVYFCEAKPGAKCDWLQ
ncbi:MAG TPA: FAD:protein FMN transferase [Bryobacteraceae bacterium]|nr:FAD:protein FMN transferase [Bryobacteraceae bacterium]